MSTPLRRLRGEMFRLHVPARGAFVRGAHQPMLLLKQYRLLVRRGSVWFGVVRRPKKGAETNNMCVVGVFVVRFGSVWFGRVPLGLVGLKTQGCLVVKKRRPPGPCSGDTKNRG